MKKRVLSVIVSFVIALSILSLDFTQVSASTDAKLSYEEAVAYKSVIDNAIAKYGKYAVRQYVGMGVGLARLIDFDGNGTLELLIGCGHAVQGDEYFYEVYEYKNGIRKLTHTYCCGSMELAFSMNLVKSGNKVYVCNSDDSICDGYSYYSTIANNSWEKTVFYSHEGEYCDSSYHPELAGKDIYKINENIVSETEYRKSIEKFKQYDDSLSEYNRYSEKGIENAIKVIDNIINSNVNNEILTGTLNERSIKDGLGYDVQCLILTLDTPKKIQATDLFGETFIATDVMEVQIEAKNYISNMDGTKVKITSYDEVFEGHTAYHIRPIVVSGAVIEIVEKGITVTLDGKKIVFDQQPIIVDGRTLVPLRAIFEELGATVNWDGNTQTVTSTKGQTTISMSIGKTEMYRNGELITLDVVPQLVGDRTLVPVRAVAESFDCKVDWDGDNQTVIIKTIDTDKVINAAKNLYQVNEDMGGVTNLASYAKVDTLLYNSLNEIDKTLAVNEFTLDMVSAGTTVTIAAAKVSTGNYSSIDNIGNGLSKLLSSKEIADAADGVLKDAIKQRVFNEITSSVPDANAFVLNLGRSAYDCNSKMIQEFIVLHSKFKSGNYTYDDAVTYIVMHDTLAMNRKTMSMAVEVLSNELPQNFLESLLMSAETSAKAVLAGLFGDDLSARNINVSAELLVDIISAYTDYKCGEGVDFFKYMKQINHPAIDEWASEVEAYNDNLVKKLNIN